MSASAGASVPSARDGDDPLVVAVDGGLVRGVREKEGAVRAFLGIPYAAPPLGPLRWRPPQPVPGWHGVRVAETFAPQCLQPGRSPDSVYAEYAGVQPMSEDCLYLNVWSAAPAADARWPVMVWFHGGAFQQGSGAYPVFVRGDLPVHGVVLVTFTYRLGPFGFMAHPALSAESAEGSSGNYGLLDMAAALEWVQRHIATFGGDPDRVTVFGQSAGAGGIVDLMTAAPTRGLFARAIAQSFGIARMSLLADAERSGSAFAERIGAADLAQLRGLDGETLLARYLERSERWMPIVDGAFIERPVRETFAAGRQHAVPFLTGWNADEGTTFPAAADAAALRSRLQVRFGAHAAEAQQLYPAKSDAEARAASLALIGDELFAWGVWRAACDQSRVALTYLYHFDHRQPFATQQRYAEAERAGELGVFHSSEYPYVFGTTAQLTRDWGDADRRVTELMQAYWLQFAATGNPNREGLLSWPRFYDATPSVMRLAADPDLIEVPRHTQLAFADRTLP
jgi:para-nitrobenzyl esterase